MKSRTPNLLHTLLFTALTFFALLAAEATVFAIAHQPWRLFVLNQRLQLLANSLTYLLALVAAWFIFPPLWHRTFAAGIHWNGPEARPRLATFGLILGFLMQATTALLPTPKKMPVEEIFHNPGLIWILAIFGTLIAPLFEEVVFRGFLLPAMGHAIDWFRHPRATDPVEISDHAEYLAASEPLPPSDPNKMPFSRPALILSSVVTSSLFALIHAPQLGRNWAPVSLLAFVSLILCAVRIRTRSLAASTLVHATYNLSVFLTLFLATGGFRHLEKI